MLHADSPYEVRLSRADGVVRIEVADAGPGTPEPQPFSAVSETGRGIVIVSAISASGGSPVCATGSPNCTSQGVSPQNDPGTGGDDPGHGNGPQHGNLPDTGSSLPPWLPPLGLLCLLLGVVLIRRSRHVT